MCINIECRVKQMSPNPLLLTYVYKQNYVCPDIYAASSMNR